MIHHGDCLDVMAAMEPESVDAIVTDPPYGLGFMGKEWDKPGMEKRATVQRSVLKRQAGGQAAIAWVPTEYQQWCEAWGRELYRVAKPSAYLLAFGGTRTVHRMTVALEDAGWIIRDMLVWAYASGFPKSKASLKPAWEPIVMARKPGPLRELAIDACRIGPPPPSVPQPSFNSPTGAIYGMKAGEGRNGEMSEASGRWPANVILTDPIFDGGIEGVVGGGEARAAGEHPSSAMPESMWRDIQQGALYDDAGTYSRFFILPKASRSDREPTLRGRCGCPCLCHADEGKAWWPGSCAACCEPYDDCACGVAGRRVNSHPTVKPTELMRHLVRLVTPPGGLVLDPFLGSGTTGLAAEMEGFPWVGIEREAEYVAIAEARLNGTQRGLGLESA